MELDQHSTAQQKIQHREKIRARSPKKIEIIGENVDEGIKNKAQNSSEREKGIKRERTKTIN